MLDYYKQALPERCRVLGLELRPLSLGHLILLHRIESVFVSESVGEANLFNELSIAVAICAQSYCDGVAMLSDPATPMAMGIWGRKLTRQTFLDRLLRRKARPLDINEECERFTDYIAAAMKPPHYSYNPSDAKQVDCPDVQIIKVALQRAFGFSDETMLDRSWSQCLWDYVTLKALDGHVEMTDRSKVSDAMAIGEKIAAALRQKGVNPNGAS